MEKREYMASWFCVSGFVACCSENDYVLQWKRLPVDACLVVAISRLNTISCLFCKSATLLCASFAKAHHVCVLQKRPVTAESSCTRASFDRILFPKTNVKSFLMGIYSLPNSSVLQSVAGRCSGVAVKTQRGTRHLFVDGCLVVGKPRGTGVNGVWIRCALVCCSVCCNVHCSVRCIPACVALQCVLQCVAACCSVGYLLMGVLLLAKSTADSVRSAYTCCSLLQFVAACCSVLQCVAVCYSTTASVHSADTCCSVLQRVAASYSMLQSVAECCSVLQHYW